MAIKEENKNRLVSLGALDQVAKKLKEAANQAAAKADAAAQAATTEANRADAAEKVIDAKVVENINAIAAINNADTGILAQAKEHAQGLVNGEKVLREQADTALDTRVKALENIVSGDSEVTLGEIIADIEENAEAIAKLNGGAEEEGSVAKAVADAVADEATLRDDADKALDARVRPLEVHVAAQPGVDAEQDRRLTALEDANKENGAVGSAIAAAQAAADNAQDAAEAAQNDVDIVEGILNGVGDQAGLIARVETNEGNIARLDGGENVEGSVKKQIKDAIDAVNGAAEDLANRVKDNENILAGLEKATVKAEIEAAQAAAVKHADDAITALVASAPDAMNTLNELAQAIEAHQDVYDAYVEQHASAMTKMKEDLQKEIDDDVKAVVDAQKLINEAQAETNEDFEARIAANEEFVKGQPGIDAEQDGRLDALEAKFKGDESVANQIANALQAAKDYADEKDAVVQGEVDALEAVVGKEAVGEDEATGIFAKMAAMKTALEGAIGDAIDDEVEARDQAIEDALLAYTDTTGIKAMMGSLVQSLTLTMENNQVVLKLGGIDGVDLTSVALDVADETDIDDLIADLESGQGE